jgi:hypothetical protein
MRWNLFTKNQNKYLDTLTFLIIGFLIVCTFILFSCKDQTTQNQSSNFVFPPSGVTFTKHVGPFFQLTCLGSQCHSENNAQGVINLQTNAYHNLLDHLPALVIYKNGKISPLVMYLDGRLAPRMPLRQDSLTTNQINGVKTWIDEGANP